MKKLKFFWIHILINAKDHFKSEIKIPLEGGLLPSTQKLQKMMFSCFRTLDHHFDCCMMTFWRARFELDTGCVSDSEGHPLLMHIGANGRKIVVNIVNNIPMHPSGIPRGSNPLSSTQRTHNSVTQRREPTIFCHINF